MTEDVWSLLTLALGVTMGMMFFVWVLAKRWNNAGIVDVAWAFGFVIVGMAFFVFGTGEPTRRLLIAAMVAVANLRLGIHLAARVARHHPVEDGRYAALREQFPKNTWLMFFGFFELQAILIAVLCVPFAIAVSNPAARIFPFEWAGVLLWFVGMAGEAIADRQLRRFAVVPENKGRTCRDGLWRYSRHPNYFFQWLIWVAYFVFAFGSPGGWISIFCPLLMLFFLLKVTGIPATEAHALKSRGEDYRAYQRTTSAFIPWFPRRS